MPLKGQIIEGFKASISVSNKEIIGQSSFLMVVGGVGRDKIVVDGAVSVNEKVWEMFLKSLALKVKREMQQ